MLSGLVQDMRETVMTESTRTALSIVDTGCSCCAPAGDAAIPTGRQSADPRGTPVGAETYQVEGMTCGHCADSVTEAVSFLNGVNDVRVELVAGGASLVSVTGLASTDAVRDAIEATGYRVLNG